VLFLILTACSWAVRLDSTAAVAQTARSSNAEASGSISIVPPSDSSPSAQAHAPIIVASGAQYANVRALATDVAGSLYISLSSTPPAKNCVSSLLKPASSAANSNAQGVAAASAPLTLTIFSNCTLAPSEDPYGIAVAPQDKIYLANRAQNTIRLLDMLNGKVSALPTGSAKNVAQGGASSNLDPYLPAGLASDPQGNLYVADRGNNRVLALAPGAAQFSFLAHVLDADAIAVDSVHEKVYAASPAANRVLLIDLSTGDAEVFAGSGAFPENANAGANGANAALNFAADPQKAQIGAPEGVAVDAQGNVFISDTGANAILRVDSRTGELSRVALAENLSSPGALTIDRGGDVFVADRGNGRIVEFPALAEQASSGSVTISPLSFAFGDELTGGTTSAEVFTLTNGSANALALNNASFTFGGADPLDFVQTNDCIPSLAAGASCQISVTFTPSQEGARSATLEVSDSDPSSPQTAALSGTGDDFELTVPNITDTTQNVAAGNNATYTISVTPDNVFRGTVTLLCPAQLSAKTTTITCTINPASLNISPGAPQQFTVTLATSGPNATRILPFAWRGGPGSRILLILFGCLALLLAVCGWRVRRAIAMGPQGELAGARPTRRMRFVAIAFALLAFAAAGGCGSSSVNPNETPFGSFPFVVTATAQNASRSITLTLNVD
jgi:streptogramin lyase